MPSPPLRHPLAAESAPLSRLEHYQRQGASQESAEDIVEDCSEEQPAEKVAADIEVDGVVEVVYVV